MVITSSVEEKPQPSNRMVANLSTDTWIGNSDQSRYVPQSHLLQKPSKSWMRTALCCAVLCCAVSSAMIILLLGMLEQRREKRALQDGNTDAT
ncbi:dual specificity tyrosine-phosphorylation-regulated kinase 1B isoform X2 [Silurus asotus]|uniref:Dual specificity tyrosine-phosphorylation-regulated kinase 1B isoform X2 n=1 Tax=Silurus asotus TaxID=30991 RepID=A0AAD5A937_SILAS|nr:dual specificity tyrosine-phosphorylation-regulated kinase 1B isoform X2 [Silurus asotus]